MTLVGVALENIRYQQERKLPLMFSVVCDE